MVERNKRGQFKKGSSGNPTGRKKRQDGEVPTSQAIRDAFYKTFVQIFVESGDPKKLVDFCKKNQMNMRLLIQEVRKILPEMVTQAEKEQATFEFSERYMPKIKIERVITDRRPVDVQDIKEIEHEPIRPVGLPEHKKSIEERIEDLKKRKAELEAKIKEKGK